MKVCQAINNFLYRVSFKIARSTKNHHYRSNLLRFNRGLVDVTVGDWDEKSREEEYRNTVLPYWGEFGYIPDRLWFELAGSRDHRMDPRFIPTDFYYMELLPYMNNLQFRFALEDKNSLDMRFPDIKQAPTVCRRIAGECYDDKMELISKESAIKLCRERGGVLFIKPSLYTGCGIGIQNFDSSECTDERIGEIFMETGTNFIVQEEIKQHEVLMSLNPDSVCTIRVMTLFISGRVYVPITYLRVSVPGTNHVTVGSEYNAEILPDGRICSKICFDEGGWFDNSTEHLFDENLVIPGIDRIREEAKRLHPRAGHFKWIGWDFTLDRDGDPLLIEYNSTPGDHAQRVCGRPLFGEMTDWVLEDFFRGRSLEDNQLRGCLCINEDIRRYRE